MDLGLASSTAIPRRIGPLRPTLFGARAALFYVVVLGAYFASPYVNLFFLLLAFLSLQWVLTLVWTWTNLHGVTADTPRVAVEQPAGERGAFAVRVGRTRGTAFDVGVEVSLERSGAPDAARANGRVDVLSGERRVEIDVPALRRGVWSARQARVTSTYPFGLLRRSVTVPTNVEFVVYPAPTVLASMEGRSAQDLMNELAGAGRAPGGDLQPTSLRDHRDGDSMRGVHWRASARRDRLVVQEWEGGTGEGLEVVLDRRVPDDVLESALSDLAALVHLARTGKEVLAIRTQGLDQTFGDGHAPWPDALRFLAEATSLDASAAPPPAASPTVLRLPRRAAEAQRASA